MFSSSHTQFAFIWEGRSGSPPTTSWGSVGDCRAQIWGLPWLQRGMFPASMSQWRQGGLPHPRLPPTALHGLPCWLRPGSQDPDSTARACPLAYYNLCPCSEEMSWGTGMPNASCALSPASQLLLWEQVWGNPVHFLPLASPCGAHLACRWCQEMWE